MGVKSESLIPVVLKGKKYSKNMWVKKCRLILAILNELNNCKQILKIVPFLVFFVILLCVLLSYYVLMCFDF